MLQITEMFLLLLANANNNRLQFISRSAILGNYDFIYYSTFVNGLMDIREGAEE